METMKLPFFSNLFPHLWVGKSCHSIPSQSSAFPPEDDFIFLRPVWVIKSSLFPTCFFLNPSIYDCEWTMESSFGRWFFFFLATVIICKFGCRLSEVKELILNQWLQHFLCTLLFLIKKEIFIEHVMYLIVQFLNAFSG